jgi:DNA topoisomerase-3
MGNAERERVQTAFLAGEREVIVATTAFGMGIDKADVRTIIHAALPAASRDTIRRSAAPGATAPRGAVLHARYVDRKTHEFFHERDYPEPDVLAAIHARLPRTPTDRATLNKRRGRAAREAFETALEKLIIHGGAAESGAGEVAKGSGDWQPGYVAQREHKEASCRPWPASPAPTAAAWST